LMNVEIADISFSVTPVPYANTANSALDEREAGLRTR
jgi:hypothetical protein